MKLHTVVLALSSVLIFAGQSSAQDSPSLGDVARQTRQQKLQNVDLQGKESQASHSAKVITNEEIPEKPEADASSEEADKDPETKVASRGQAKIPAEVWKSKILAQKTAIATQEAQMQHMNDSIHFASGNCVRGCVQWNERQVEKQDEVERMRANLEEQKKHLQDMEEAARQQGYGGSVYDP